MRKEKVRQSVISGRWYPGRPERLRQTIEDFMNDVEPHPIDGKLIGLISPHAGYV